MSVLPASHRHENEVHLKSRVSWVDLAKGLGIFLVVFGHTLGGLIDSGALQNSLWSQSVRGIYTFHMPLFFFLAGLFVKQSARRPFDEYFLNKASVIIYPYFLWSILEGTAQVLASRLTNNQLTFYSLLKILYIPIDQFWFLYAIFLMYLVYWLVNYRSVSNTSFLLFAAALYAIEASGFDVSRWDVLHSFCSFLIYFALGAMAAQTSVLTILTRFAGPRLLSIAIVGYGVVAAAVAANLSELPFFHAVLAMTGTIATIALAMLLAGSPLASSTLSSVVKTMGFYSLEIYVAHTIFAAATRIALQKGFGYSGPILQIVLGTAVGISIPIILAVWGPKVGLPYLFTWSRSRQNVEISPIKSLRT